jgi:hypothetical protein
MLPAEVIMESKRRPLREHSATRSVSTMPPPFMWPTPDRGLGRT